MKAKQTGLSRRYVAVLGKLKREVFQRRAVEKELRANKQHHKCLLEEACTMQEQLRHLSRQIILTQEAERKEISRELHNEIAQTLAGINVHLAALKAEARVNKKGLKEKVIRTQRLVEKAVNVVHRFARDLRPAILDDLGLTPAIHSYIKNFTKRTGIIIHFKASRAVEKLNSVKRTVLYRVIQLVLTNVVQYSHASFVKVTIQKKQRFISMEIKDNGKFFQAKRALSSKKINRLGLIGMRERLEMVGGKFVIAAAKGQGTTIQAEVPLA